MAAWNIIRTRVVSDLQTALSTLRSDGTDVTINIYCGYGEVDNQTMGSGDIGQSMYFVDTETYANIRTTLSGFTGLNTLQTSAFNPSTNLPATDPFGWSETILIASALTKALGFWTGSATDGYCGFSSSASFDITSVDGSTCTGGYSLYGVMMHEFTEVLGREMNTGANTTFYIADIFTYSASGTRNNAASGTRYLSSDGGATSIVSMNNNTNGDTGDNLGSTPYASAFNAFGSTGFAPSTSSSVPLKPIDWLYMTIIGWGLTGPGLGYAGLSSSGGPGATVAVKSSGIPMMGG
jgi:hypothetical protein